MPLLSKDKETLLRIVKFLFNLDCLQAIQEPSFLTANTFQHPLKKKNDQENYGKPNGSQRNLKLFEED